MCEVIVKFALSFSTNSSDGMARLDANITKYAPEMELYIILAILENSDTLNHKMSSSQAKPVHCSPVIIGFSSDKINILQHIKHLFNTIADSICRSILIILNKFVKKIKNRI